MAMPWNPYHLWASATSLSFQSSNIEMMDSTLMDFSITTERGEALPEIIYSGSLSMSSIEIWMIRVNPKIGS
jgi:hypothetical protein